MSVGEFCTMLWNTVKISTCNGNKPSKWNGLVKKRLKSQYVSKCNMYVWFYSSKSNMTPLTPLAGLSWKNMTRVLEINSVAFIFSWISINIYRTYVIVAFFEWNGVLRKLEGLHWLETNCKNDWLQLLLNRLKR